MCGRISEMVAKPTMSNLLLAIVTVIYLGVAVGYWREGRREMALVFVAYALANCGLILENSNKT